MTDNRYRPCVGVALINKQGLVFIGRRAAKKAAGPAAGYEWQMPQGGIEKGEEPQAAARRELWEETGVSSVSVLAETEGWLTYDLPPDVASERFGGKFVGQAQKWFAVRFEGSDQEIDLGASRPGCEPEFDAWRWARMRELPNLVIPFKRKVYDAVVAAFERFASI